MSLFPWQVNNAQRLVESLTEYGYALDASETGTGKTYVAAEVCRTLGRTPLVVCPKSVIPSWRRVLSEFGVDPLLVINIESLKRGKTMYLKPGKRKNEFVWNMDRNSLVVFDEAHRFAAPDSQNAYVLALTKAYRIPALMLSATIADSPLRMRSVGYLLELHQFRNFWNWCLSNGCYRNQWNGVEFTTNQERKMEVLKGLHGYIFPARGVRSKIADLPDFPENEVIAEAYDLGEQRTEVIEEAYEEEPQEEENPLVVMLRARQVSEMQKVPFLIEAVEDALDEGRSAVVFFCFRESLLSFRDKWTGEADRDIAIVMGEQDSDSREAMVQAFQADHRRVMLCTIQAGGVGLSLHDLNGMYPRSSFICPTFSAVDLVQALGRIHRAGAKSKAVQRIVFAAGTVEEKACSAVRRKLDNLSLLNDGDLMDGLKV